MVAIDQSLILALIMLVVGLILGRELTKNAPQFNLKLPKLPEKKRQAKGYRYKPVKAKVVRRSVDVPRFRSSGGSMEVLLKDHPLEVKSQNKSMEMLLEFFLAGSLFRI